MNDITVLHEVFNRLSYESCRNYQSWALAHLFEVRYPLTTQFFPMDRWRSCVHFLDFLNWATLHPYWATPHPQLSHVSSFNWATSHPSTEPSLTLYWFMPHPGWATPHDEMSHIATWTESRHTLNWVTPHPELSHTAPSLSHAAHYQLSHTTPSSEQRGTLQLSHAEPCTEPSRTLTEPHCTLNWATPHPELSHAAPSLSLATPYWATVHPELSHPAPLLSHAPSSTEPCLILQLSQASPWTESRRTLN